MIRRRVASVVSVALAQSLTACGAGSGQDQPALGVGGGAVVPTAGGSASMLPGGAGNPSMQVLPGGGGASPAAAGGALPPSGASGGAPPVTGGAGGAPPIGTGGFMAGSGGDAVGSGGAPAGTGGASSTGGSSGNPDGQGCGQGQFCQAGDDLAPPAPDQGFQIVTPPSLTVNPGAEGFWCYYKSIPGSGEVDIGGFRAWMTKGTSHHFITFHGANGPDGTLVSCAFGNGEWIFATSKSGLIVGTDLPQNVGLPYNGGDSLTLNIHVVNTGTDVAQPVVKLNVLYAKDTKYKAGSVFQAMLGANPQIAVPPGGTQTVRASCRAAPGSNFFLWTTHSHKFTTKDTIDYISGGQTTNIVTTTDWENPGTHFWTAPNFLTTKAGDTFSYSCTYQNPGALPITFGETAAYNEMCIAIGYYFPVDTTGQTNCF